MNRRRNDRPSTAGRVRPRLRRIAQTLAVALVGGGIVISAAPAAVAAPCDPGNNPIVCENSKGGTSDWQISGVGSAMVEGFATSMSVNAGQSISFKIRTMSSDDDTATQVQKPYSIDIYRLGYYGGAGGRLWGSATPTLRNQPACANDTSTGLVDCGGWAVSASWAVPSNAVSGVYVAHMVRPDAPQKDNHIIFVVRNDSSTSTLVAQTSDTTWQAYNDWGGNSLYGGQPAGRAYKVSYNRPFATRMTTPDSRDFFFGSEYSMVRFMERNGYDVSYISGIDSDRDATQITRHKTFVSMGHDEYWSKNQRANVTAARDAGVNLAFFSGNEVFWKTRWENSQDGTSTPYRTLVTYKETKADAVIDPSPEWTGTWRDPRFKDQKPDAGNQENSLTGQFWTVNTGTYPIEVPAADGKMRFWRNTSVANLAAGTKATLAADTLGYEWDEDPDNGSRPAGLIRMSTTTQNVPAKIIDYGSTVAPGEATHHLTMYKIGTALVFGAGTVQWSWGLDAYHDGNQTPTDVRIQQATVNILADMGAQPATLMSGLVAAAKSTDTTAPDTIITSPTSSATPRSGSSVTVTGTASDLGGGRVGGVEVSLDNGTTWHPATGRESWSYAGTVSGTGAVGIKARAVDDSLNMDQTPASVSVTGVCPCTLFADLDTAKSQSPTSDTRAINLGTRFSADRNGYITGVRFYKATGNSGTHVGALWTTTGQKLAQVTFTNESATGWQTANFTPAPAVTANTQYVISYNAPNGAYSYDAEYFQYWGKDRAPLHAARTTGTAANGVYGYGTLAYPTDTYRGGNYWVDPIFDTVAPPDTIPPVATPGTPLAGSSSVSRTTPVTVTFDEPVQAASVAITVTGPGGAAAGTVAYDSATRTGTFTPTGTLAADTLYTASVSGVKDVSGNTMTSAVTWSFRTQKAPAQAGVCPCSVWDDTATPQMVTVTDAQQVELGMKFTADSDGTVTGLRFYKGPQNTGTHVGSIWNSTGTTRLGQVTFGAETTQGWQTASFATPVTVTAGTTYVVSYNTSSGYYSATTNGLLAAVHAPPLHTVAGGGLYKYGASAFPTNQSNANYWVDPVFKPAPDTTPPTVVSTAPAQGATNVSVSGGARATFNEPMTAGSITMTLKAGGTDVPGTVSYNATTKAATFQPSAVLTGSTLYTATVTAASDAAGNAMTAPKTWTFTTAGAATCPCTLFSDDSVPTTPAVTDAGAVELGMKFSSNTNGWISGVRFYKGTGNGGTHTGSLWSASGTRLATGTFTAETATGWQQLTFANPVPVTAGTTYTASYFAPQGRYAVDSNYFASAVSNLPLTAPAGGNGVFRYGSTSGFPQNSYGASNYWVDPVFVTAQPSDTTPPQVTDRSPAQGATSVPTTGPAKAVFNEDLVASTVQMTLAPNAGGAAVAGTVAYDANERTASFTPTAALESATVYKATVTAANDLAGNALAAPVSWTFTTAAASTGTCPCSLFADSATPAIASAADAGPLELGIRFSSDTDGFIRGVKFYKGANNTGTHTGSLWSTTGPTAGQRLATGTFTNESASGWQTLLFATPVAVTAGTTYVASYFAPQGGYSLTRYQFEFAGVDKAPLHAPRAQAGAPNGLYVYGSTSAMPVNGSDSNYWVDVVFAPTAG